MPRSCSLYSTPVALVSLMYRLWRNHVTHVAIVSLVSGNPVPKQARSSRCERKVKISYEIISSSSIITALIISQSFFKVICESVYLQLQMIHRYIKFSTLYHGISHYFSEILRKVGVRRKVCKWLYWNLREKMSENVCGSDQF